MNKPVDFPLSAAHDDEEDSNPSTTPRLSDLIEARLSRRSMLRGAVGSGATAVFGSLALSACGGGDAVGATESVQSKPPVLPGKGNAETLLGFDAVAKSVADTLSVPAGYTATVLYAAGDPLHWSTPDYRNDGSDTRWDERAGDCHDGIEFFGLSANRRDRDPNAVDRGLLAMNHEYAVTNYLHAAGATPNGAATRPAGEIDKEVAAHGISVVEVRRYGKAWKYERGSSFNRRITPLTPAEFSGPGRGHALLATKYDPTGRTTRGTLNNCGTGRTPWGTLLSGEENWAGYFFRPAGDAALRSANENVALARYGRGGSPAASRYAWEKSDAPGDVYERWNIGVRGATAADDYRNEINAQGWMLEVDPYAPNLPPKKRTTMGRFAHENGCFSKLVHGEPLAIYLGDDAQGEYVYRFVSAQPWDDADRRAANRYATGDKYLDAGTLYVAKYHDDGTGEWIELSLNNPAVRDYTTYRFADDADVLMHARIAADAVGATRMDRPEWCATHPGTGEVYSTMTNNSSRSVATTNAANPRAYVDPEFGGQPRTGSALNPRNWNGHIVRMREAGGKAAAQTFTWDVYLFGSEAGFDPLAVNLSGLTDDQDFSSPDGLWFSPNTGICWIQTDDGNYTDVTNDQMLAALPGRVGDGQTVTIDYGSRQVTTYVGARPTDRTLKRFLVGPAGCEVTGVTESGDARALFVNIQHPGEAVNAALVAAGGPFQSRWPANAGYGAGARPRSTTAGASAADRQAQPGERAGSCRPDPSVPPPRDQAVATPSPGGGSARRCPKQSSNVKYSET